MRYLTTDGEFLPLVWKTPYNHDTNAVARETALYCKDPSLAQQHQEQEANINNIVERFGITGKLPEIPLPPLLDEFQDIFDFQSAMNAMAAAKQSFQALAPEVRDAFHNDPHRFVSQVDAMLQETDPAEKNRNLGILRGWGLAVQPGPVPDRTTLGDVLKAIKEQGGTPGGTPTPTP